MHTSLPLIPSLPSFIFFLVLATTYIRTCITTQSVLVLLLLLLLCRKKTFFPNWLHQQHSLLYVVRKIRVYFIRNSTSKEESKPIFTFYIWKVKKKKRFFLLFGFIWIIHFIKIPPYNFRPCQAILTARLLHNLLILRLNKYSTFVPIDK